MGGEGFHLGWLVGFKNSDTCALIPSNQTHPSPSTLQSEVKAITVRSQRHGPIVQMEKLRASETAGLAPGCLES